MPIIGGFGLLVMALWIFCLVDVITANEYEVRHLPKMGWLLVVLILPLVGSIIWLVAGRPQTARAVPPPPSNTRFREYDRPGRHVAADPMDDEEFLRRCRERAEQQRRDAHERSLRSESSNTAPSPRDEATGLPSPSLRDDGAEQRRRDDES